MFAGVRWVKNLGILVKLWGKGNSLIGKSTFSSYAMVLMLLHYLIKKGEISPIMDARVRNSSTPSFKYKRSKGGDF